MAAVKSLVRSIARAALARLGGGAGASRAVPYMARWAGARQRALLRGRGLVRGAGIVWPQHGRAWVMDRDYALPGRGEVLIETAVSAVSAGTERAYFLGLPNAVTDFPTLPGYSLAGTVVEIGRGVSAVRPGDRVALAAPHASLAVGSAVEVYAVPAGVSMEEAAFVSLALIALQALQKVTIIPGNPIAILGHGIIGQLLAQFLCAFGAYPVTSVSRSGRRATEALQRTMQRVILVDRDGVDALDHVDAAVTFDATGHPDGVAFASRCTRPGGRVVLVGSTRGVTEAMDFGALADRRIALVGAHINSLTREDRPVEARRFFRLLKEKRIAVAPLITHRVHPLEAEWFYRRLAGRDDASIAAVFTWDALPSVQRMRRVSFLAPPDLGPLRRAALVEVPLADRVRMNAGTAAG